MSRPFASSPDVELHARGRAFEFVRERAWVLTVWGAMGVWAAVEFATARSDYLSFRIGKFDLGNMVQAVWSSAQGRPLEITAATGEQASRLGTHVDPILVLLTPFWIAAPTPVTLPAISIAAAALGALPVFWLGRRHLGSEKIAALLALSYLAYPWLAWSARDFHPVTLAVPLFLFCVWFLDGDRLLAFAACAVLVALSGELMGITLAALGIWYALARGRRAGLVVAVLGIAWTFAAMYVVAPAFGEGQSAYYGYYGSVGGSPFGVIRTMLTDPGAILSALATAGDVRYLLALALPLLGLFVLAPGLAAVSLPSLLANGLSDYPLTTQPHQHYSSAAIPFLVVATVVGFTRIPVARRASAAKLVLATCVGLSIVFGTMPGAPAKLRLWHADVPQAKVDALRDAVALVPDDAPVAVTNRVGAHLSARRVVYSVPTDRGADWIVLDAADAWIPWRVAGREDPEALQDFLRRTEMSPVWSKVFEREGVFVFRRVSTESGLA